MLSNGVPEWYMTGGTGYSSLSRPGYIPGTLAVLEAQNPAYTRHPGGVRSSEPRHIPGTLAVLGTLPLEPYPIFKKR